ncbi:thioredoxin domain-containing protein 5 homolog [Anopheles marshallii]|uniref:thioredoxin domain-containing protein 5 homolog n=1 Tax=Anopheles marshallii TaxID=1521116 RepID=UPI00237B79D0|nr:thioredoxin domain-containing protein 5 homolog [Anopheles marshallii]
MAVMQRTVTVMVALLVTLASGHSDTTSVHLTKDNFQTELDGSSYFVMFYAPWCDYCKKLAPVWASLAEARNGEPDGQVKIGRVDCTTDGDLCTQHDITGYPMMKLFRKGASDGEGGTKYRGGRDLALFNAFLDEQLSVTGDGAKGTEGEDGSQEDAMPDAPPAPVSPLTELTEDTFAKHVSSGKHFVKFYAPWCGHCTKLAPTWEELARSLEHERDIRVSKIDCTQYRPICTDFEVKGYPTLLWIEDGKKIEKYTGPRTHGDLKQYVARMAGGLKEDDQADKKEGTLEGGAERDDNRSVVVQLSEGDFAHAIAKGVTVVKFYAPWCGHCMRLAPTWEQLAEKLAARDDVKIAKVDCTVDANKELCGEQEVNGYPTVFLYHEGEKVTEYFGHRSLDDLHEFVMQHLQDNGPHDEL